MRMMITTNVLSFLQTCLFWMLLVLNIYGGHSKFGDDGAKCRKTEQMALLQFKAELIDEYGRLSSWGSTNCCEWKGVVCDNRTNHVVALDLHGRGDIEYRERDDPLRGKIDPSLLQLPHLHYLDLSFNDFNGTIIPSFIGDLSKLQHLNLTFSNLGGPIPHHIGNLSALQHLDLHGNGLLTSTNLDWLSGFQSLEYLDLSYVNLTTCTTWLQPMQKLTALNQLLLSNCELPTVVEPISVPSHNSSNSLVVLDLSYNYLISSGVFHWFLNMSSSITYIDFSYSNIEGGIPDALGSLMSLYDLDLRSSNLRGRIPQVLGNLTSLSYLDLSVNQLQGEFPRPSKNLSSLTYLHLSFNNLNGQLPHLLAWIGDYTRLEYLSVSYNALSGLFPNMSRFTLLKMMSFGYNQLNGALLDDNLRLPNLEYLDLSSNKFTGVVPNFSSLSGSDLEGGIPDALGSLMSLYHLDLRSSNLRGRIPQVLGNLTSLSYLDLNSNEIEGMFPRPSKNLSSLKYLELSGNNLSGQLPHLLAWIGDSTRLEYLFVSYNALSGLFPNMSRFTLLKMMFLGNNQLNGALLDDNLRLPNLEYLDLSSNKFIGILPSNLRLPNLEYLYLSSNEFTGVVPNFSSCPSLRVLALSYNTLKVILKESIGNLSKIEILRIGYNELEGVVTEAHLSSLPHLTYLDLSFNLNVTISITPSWVHPIQFSWLKLANCNLGPYFPKWLRKQKQLEFLDISNSAIFGIVPDWFWGNMQECVYLNMSHNHIHGVLPNLSSQSKEILSIDLSSNEFSGSLPLLPPLLSNIDLSRNKFSGTILHFCNFIKYSDLFIDLSNNLLSGEIPEECFMILFNQQYLNLAHNNFSGEIRTPNNSDCQFFSLHLRNNSFRGEIPRSLMNCSELSVLDLGENGFSGKIPELGESMPVLGVLILKSNMLWGSLPSSICHLSNLQVLDISMNKITGPIPKCINNFTQLSLDKADSNSWKQLFSSFRNRSNDFHDSASVIWKGNEQTYFKSLGLLKVIDLSSNELTGEIPHELTSLIGILGLNISGNNLVGFIPDDIDELGELNFLDLSRNKLSGRIPPTLSKLSHLGVLNLSFNDLSGRIPWESHMQTFEASTYLGNPRLCGPPLESRPCPEDVKPRNGSHGSEDEDEKFTTRGCYISMVLGFIGAFWVVFWSLFFSKWWNALVMKIYNTVGDWLYVHVLINKRRLLRCFDGLLC